MSYSLTVLDVLIQRDIKFYKTERVHLQNFYKDGILFIFF